MSLLLSLLLIVFRLQIHLLTLKITANLFVQEARRVAPALFPIDGGVYAGLQGGVKGKQQVSRWSSVCSDCICGYRPALYAARSFSSQHFHILVVPYTNAPFVATVA